MPQVDQPQTEVTAAPAAAPKPAPKPPTKPKAKPAPVAKKADKTKTGPVVDGKSRQKLWNAKRVQIVTALRKLNANSAMESKTAEAVAKKAANGMTEVHVVRYCAEQEPLVAGGLVKRAKLEGEPQITYYLTAKGKNCQIPT